ncbi:MAG: phosphoribosylformylglycinamidine synthase subunit PurL [Chloroflexi bacterium]|nr:phosphoribosylformylglycinamidine synthase subunit PurL [Chloroflexota bacterium]
MPQNIYRIEITPRLGSEDGRAKAIRRSAQSLPLTIGSIIVSNLYFIGGELSLEQAQALAQTALLDPVADTLDCRPLDLAAGPRAGESTIEITYLPGVTDSVAESLLSVARSLGYKNVRVAASGWRYRFLEALDEEILARLARDLLANDTVQRFAINRPIAPPFVESREFESDRPLVETIPLRDLTPDHLLALSRERRLSLDRDEMLAIQAYYRQQNRDPTDVELETLAQTWSEHCVHKTFKAIIHYREEPDGEDAVIDGLLDTYIRAATEAIAKPWVHSAFVDNAGVIAFDETLDLAFKVETHNHPSALEPFGGANTGVGGVIRDILGVSARPIANTDVLCFGPENLPAEQVPAGSLHPRRVVEGVIHGIEDYGNKMGIPTVNGAVHYHRDFTANPLVYCGCLGALPRGSHRPLTNAQAGDLIVAIGGRTGRDGLRGATFSSMEMDHATAEIAGTAVQIGNPIVEKQVMEVVLRARDAGLYHAITDCGAGGFSSAVGEMGEHVGARVQLKGAPLKYPGLRPWEIWLSEAQERMVLAIPSQNWDAFQAICRAHDVEASILGEFDGSKRLRVYYGETLVADLEMAFLHDGVPRRRLRAVWTRPGLSEPNLPPSSDLTPLLLQALAHANVRSRAAILHRYDHEVQGGTVVKPLVGAGQRGPGDAAVILPQATLVGREPDALQHESLPAATLSVGINPRYGLIDPYFMAWACVDEAVRNAVAVGADPDRIAILDNFCWGNPNLPDRLGSLVRAARGCYDAALAHQTPFISGKDSLNNEYTGADGRKHAIPGSLLISAVGVAPDMRRTTTTDLKEAGHALYLLGETRPELGGSVYYDLFGELGASVPRPYDAPLDRMRGLHRAIVAGWAAAVHDLSEGGLAVALAEMCIGGDLGAEISLAAIPTSEPLTPAQALFSESLGRFLIEVPAKHAIAFEKALAGQPLASIGRVTAEKRLIVRTAEGRPCIDASVKALAFAFGALE